MVIEITQVIRYEKLIDTASNNFGFMLGVSLLEPLTAFDTSDSPDEIANYNYVRRQQVNLLVKPSDVVTITRLNSGHLVITGGPEPILMLLDGLEDTAHLFPFFLLNGTANGLLLRGFKFGSQVETRRSPATNGWSYTHPATAQMEISPTTGAPRPPPRLRRPAPPPPRPQPKIETPAEKPVPPPADPDQRVCVICFERESNTLFMDCRHMKTCEECAKSVQKASGKCPICRQPINDVIKVFT